jgi:glutathione synthase/RimK-type ligase-like ATP-grasp enzyme
VAVLILAHEADVHAQAVTQEIARLGTEVVIADLSQFPQWSQLNAHFTCCGERQLELTIAGRTYDLNEFGAIWWRRPQHPQVSSDLANETYRLFATNEATEALTGVWYALDAFWVNNPAKDHVAHRKIMQLRVAQDCGFTLPDTLITNDPVQARIFIDRHGYRNVIYKAFSALEQAWRETRLLRPEELALLDHVKYAPVIFQEYVEAIYDIRITVIGNAVFAAAIHSQQTSYPTDFRMDMANAAITPVDLPPELTARLLNYMTVLDLEYGAIDMRLRPDGKHVFLEINPAGQWLFVEEATKQPIAATLARLLVNRDIARFDDSAKLFASSLPENARERSGSSKN